MIENLPDVSHLRYRGEPVEWRRGAYFGGYRLLSTSENVGSPRYLCAVVPDGDVFYGGAYQAANSSRNVGGDDFEHDDAAIVAAEVIRRLLVFNIVTSVDGHETDDTASSGYVFTISAELYALVAAVAARRGQSTDDFLNNIVTTKAVSIAVVDYRDDAEIRRLHIALAESWGRK